MAAPHALSIYVTHAMPLKPDRSGFKSPLSLSSCVSVGQLLSLLSLTFHVCKMGIINLAMSFGYCEDSVGQFMWMLEPGT